MERRRSRLRGKTIRRTCCCCSQEAGRMWRRTSAAWGTPSTSSKWGRGGPCLVVWFAQRLWSARLFFNLKINLKPCFRWCPPGSFSAGKVTLFVGAASRKPKSAQSAKSILQGEQRRWRPTSGNHQNTSFPFYEWRSFQGRLAGRPGEEQGLDGDQPGQQDECWDQQRR